jgi:hypothetical protein
LLGWLMETVRLSASVLIHDDAFLVSSSDSWESKGLTRIKTSIEVGVGMSRPPEEVDGFVSDAATAAARGDNCGGGGESFGATEAPTMFEARLAWFFFFVSSVRLTTSQRCSR